jgi:hypothetical protein
MAIMTKPIDLNKLNALLCNIAQILDVVKQEWGESWSAWDQEQREEITRVMLAIDGEK